MKTLTEKGWKQK